jgi:hypothetical protein
MVVIGYTFVTVFLLPVKLFKETGHHQQWAPAAPTNTGAVCFPAISCHATKLGVATDCGGKKQRHTRHTPEQKTTIIQGQNDNKKWHGIRSFRIDQTHA